MNQELIDKNIKAMNRLRLISDSLNFVVVAFVDEVMQKHANLKDRYFIGSEDSIIVDDLLKARSFSSKDEALKVKSDFELKVFPLSFLVKYELKRLSEENKKLRNEM